MESKGRAAPSRVKAVQLNNGRIAAQIEDATDPEGRPTAQVRVASQCPLDSYRRRGWITVEEWRAGEQFRQLCQTAAVGPQYAKLQWRERVDTSRQQERAPTGHQERARRALHRIEGFLGATPASILRSVLIERRSAAAWAKARGFRETSGMDFLRDALATLADLQGAGAGRK